MNPKDHHQLEKQLFTEANELPPAEREAWLRRACGTDGVLLAKLKSMLEDETVEAFSNDFHLEVSRQVGEVIKPFPIPSLLGEVLNDRYRVDAEISEGGMGKVYKGWDMRMESLVAIKVLSDRFNQNPDFVERFRREAQAARRIEHPHVVAIYDLGTTPTNLNFMVMQYLEGQPLHEVLRSRGRFSPEEAVRLIEPIAGALAEAHGKGVIHRDVKLANIMACRGPAGTQTVKLLDLGIAKMESTHTLTASGTIQGTPHYMSPEQWGAASRDGGNNIDHRADIYSLGVVLHELVAGQKPFEGDTQTLYHQHCFAPPPKLHEIVPGIPPAFSRVIERTLAKDRSGRPATCTALMVELGNALQPGDAGQVREEVSAPPVHSGSAAGKVNQADETAVDTFHNRPTVPDQPARDTNPDRSGRAATREHTGAVPTAPAVAPPNQPWAEPPPLPVDLVIPSTRRAKKIPAYWPALAGLLVLMLAGSWWIWTVTHPAKPADPPPDPPAEVEALRYWLEVAPNPDSPSERRIGPVTLTKGEALKFHFKPSRDGYLYIVGPGKDNAPTTFLTAKPAPKSDLTTNAVKADEDTSFPKAGNDNWILMGPETEPDVYQVVFSRTPLTEPAFFTAPANHELTEAELREWTEFQKTARGGSLHGVEGKFPSVVVSLPKSAETEKPLLIHIQIDHRK